VRRYNKEYIGVVGNVELEIKKVKSCFDGFAVFEKKEKFPNSPGRQLFY
jgi:hypothetical protein